MEWNPRITSHGPGWDHERRLRSGDRNTKEVTLISMIDHSRKDFFSLGNAAEFLGISRRSGLLNIGKAANRQGYYVESNA